MRDWATEQFKQAGFRIHQGKPKGESPLLPLLRLLESFGFKISEDKGGTHKVAYHPDLEGWILSPIGIITIPIKHSGSGNKPMAKEHYVILCLKAIDHLHQKGVIGHEQAEY